MLSFVVAQSLSHVRLFVIPWTAAHQASLSFTISQSLLKLMSIAPVHGDSPGKNTGVGCHSLLQGILLTQGSNLHLLHCRWILLSHREAVVSAGVNLYLTLPFWA